MDIKLLIVGAKGQVGSSLCSQAQQGWQVLAVDRDELDISEREGLCYEQ